MAKCILSFGDNGQYFYNGSSNKYWRTTILPENAKSIQWLAFGATADSYFVSYLDESGGSRILRGSGLPATLKDWLVDPETSELRRSKKCRVALGPNDSFVAWDGDATKWKNIPTRLEDRLQEYVSERKRWGALRVICLGKGASYFIVTERGGWSSSGLPFKMKEMLMEERDSICETSAAALSMFDDRWVFVQTKRHCYDVLYPERPTEAEEEGLCTVLDSVHHDKVEVLRRKVQRYEARLTGRDAQLRESTARQQQHESRIRELEQEKEVISKRAARAGYAMWERTCDKYFATDKHQTFITMPVLLQECQDLGCVTRKKDTGNIKLCKHELEMILRGSEKYNIKFLRTERLRWHPDQFARICDTALKQQLTAKAAQMFAIIEELIVDERSVHGEENASP